jgi:thymidylate kinase
MKLTSLAPAPGSVPTGQAAHGLLVAVFGADGSGKTSVCRAVLEELAPHFGGVRYLHFRPRIGSGDHGGDPVSEPHRDPPRGRLASLAKVAFYVADHRIGHAVRIRRDVSRGTLVLFDRYFHDLIVDPRRYRYGGSARALSFAARLIPRPDLVLLLDAPTEVLLARKPEVEPSELERIRRAYLDVVGNLPDSHVVDASRPLSEVTARVGRLIAGRARVSGVSVASLP